MLALCLTLKEGSIRREHAVCKEVGKIMVDKLLKRLLVMSGGGAAMSTHVTRDGNRPAKFPIRDFIATFPRSLAVEAVPFDIPSRIFKAEYYTV